MFVGDPKLVRLAPLRIAGPAMLGNFNKAQGNKLPDCRRDRMPVGAVALKIVVGYRQPTVVHPAMACQFDFKPIQYSPRCVFSSLQRP